MIRIDADFHAPLHLLPASRDSGYSSARTSCTRWATAEAVRCLGFGIAEGVKVICHPHKHVAWDVCIHDRRARKRPLMNFSCSVPLETEQIHHHVEDAGHSPLTQGTVVVLAMVLDRNSSEVSEVAWDRGPSVCKAKPWEDNIDSPTGRQP